MRCATNNFLVPFKLSSAEFYKQRTKETVTVNIEHKWSHCRYFLGMTCLLILCWHFTFASMPTMKHLRCNFRFCFMDTTHHSWVHVVLLMIRVVLRFVLCFSLVIKRRNLEWVLSSLLWLTLGQVIVWFYDSVCSFIVVVVESVWVSEWSFCYVCPLTLIIVCFVLIFPS